MQHDLPRVVGAGPLIAAVCDAIGLPEIIDERVAWDPARCNLSPGERIKALIINMLTQRMSLYRIGEAFERSNPSSCSVKASSWRTSTTTASAGR